MTKITTYFQFVNSADFGDYALIKIPDLTMSDFIKNPFIRASLEPHFGPLWVVAWKTTLGFPSLITNQNTLTVAPTEVERYLNGQWKTKQLEIK